MFVIIIRYKKPLQEVDKCLEDHRSFIKNGYDNNYFVASGPVNPRTGGVILCHLKDRSKVEEIITLDPFHAHDLANYEIIEFEPTRYDSKFSCFV